MIDLRVIKNAAFLYLRMLVLIIITLITTKLLLQYLGIVDFGIYSLVWGVILALGFVNNSITNSVQRFLNVALGREDIVEAKKIYSTSLIIFIILGIGLSILLFFIKDILIFQLLKIPLDKKSIADQIYQLMVVSFFFQFISLHFISCLIAKEKFSIFSLITVLEGVFKLIGVVLLIYFSNKLVAYASFLLISSFFIFTILAFYSILKIDFCKYRLNKNLLSYKEILSFISWNIFGGLGVVSSAQGIPIIANIFYGVVINGSISIANQLNGLIGTVTSNFQKAFSPYLVKLFVQDSKIGDKIVALTKVSVLFYSIVSIPLILYSKDLLIIWLNKVPHYVDQLVQISAITALFEVLSGPLWMLIQAEGNIKRYQLSVFWVMVLTLPSAFLILYLGYSIYYVWFMLMVFNLGLFIIRLFFVNNIIENNFINDYIYQVILPTLFFLIVSFIMAFGLKIIFYSQIDIQKLIFLNIIALLLTLGSAFTLLLNTNQRKSICLLFKSKLNM